MTPRIIGMIVGSLAVLAFVFMAFTWRSQRNDLRDWQADVVSATRTAADNPKLSKKLVAQQIGLLGGAIKQCKAGIANQNAAIGRLAETTEAQKVAITEASKRATARVGAVEATRRGLEASSRSGEAQAKPCAPSKALAEAWQ